MSGPDYASSQSINDIVNELTQRPENYGITKEELARLLKIKDVFIPPNAKLFVIKYSISFSSGFVII